ncbi:MAG: methionyl-tRNA formyltransferase [Candidatus Saccharimonadales bacterium]
MSKQIIFFGNEKLATGINTKARVFSSLINNDFDIKALVISQRTEASVDLEIVKIAKLHHIDVLSLPNLKQAANKLASYKVDVAVLAAFGKIVPKDILNIFNIGIINIHPSLLPKHRGPTPIESTILNGDKQTGVSIMRLSEEMDTGPIYKQRSIDLSGKETKQQLADSLDEVGQELLLESLEDILSGKLTPTNQPIHGATYDKIITKNDGVINWQESWQTIERKIRAYAGWPKSRCTLGSKEATILEIHRENGAGKPGSIVSNEGNLGIYCQDGLVIIDKLVPSGSKPMSGKDFLLGYKNLLL